MTYLWLTLVFIGAAATVALVARRRMVWAAVGVTLLVMNLLTAVFDNLMIAAEFFHYEDAHLSGLAVGLAPVEDFSYPIAGALLLPALWHLLLRRDSRGRSAPRPSAAPSGGPEGGGTR
ncbi:MAG: lycopene cyclase domain-containing protein [Nesterenkonia sp.]|uniref:lycopene cyclase domain-containing protein n=1 Tax=Nesterenkonia marinintestina TaxID=2979865 RepID=UPI0021C17DF4|nr:lycopene cyclase domain-containing protein [Nesterenkonia sp. GX14115]MDO5494000.1 lycopene cyclase domain-containing protein [Nesterenkonia sp.]